MKTRLLFASAGVLLSLSLAACTQSPERAGASQAASSPSSQSASAPPSIARPWGRPDLTSGLNIPPGEQFIFAGGQSKPFTAFVTNRGEVPVRIVADLDGATTPIVMVEPGQKVSHRFDARQAALFENPSEQEARLVVEVWGQTNVGMKYLPMMTDAGSP